MENFGSVRDTPVNNIIGEGDLVPFAPFSCLSRVFWTDFFFAYNCHNHDKGKICSSSVKYVKHFPLSSDITEVSTVKYFQCFNLGCVFYVNLDGDYISLHFTD